MFEVRPRRFKTWGDILRGDIRIQPVLSTRPRWERELSRGRRRKQYGGSRRKK